MSRQRQTHTLEFGRYAGRPLGQMPTAYLVWVATKTGGPVRSLVLNELDRRRRAGMNVPEPSPRPAAPRPGSARPVSPRNQNRRRKKALHQEQRQANRPFKECDSLAVDPAIVEGVPLTGEEHGRLRCAIGAGCLVAGPGNPASENLTLAWQMWCQRRGRRPVVIE